ncbi:MAG TPA: anthranilate phosphoribosyltransferase, partial [Thermoanaerobaculia bacterium]
GEQGPRREAVLLNVAVALTVEGRARNISEGYAQSQAAIDEGRARSRFEDLKVRSRDAAGAAS